MLLWARMLLSTRTLLSESKQMLLSTRMPMSLGCRCRHTFSTRWEQAILPCTIPFAGYQTSGEAQDVQGLVYLCGVACRIMCPRSLDSSTVSPSLSAWGLYVSIRRVYLPLHLLDWRLRMAAAYWAVNRAPYHDGEIDGTALVTWPARDCSIPLSDEVRLVGLPAPKDHATFCASRA